MNYTLNQLAHSKLLPPSVSAAIMADSAPPVSELMEHLLTTAMDAYFVTKGDQKTSWTERRLSHQNLVMTFMVALLLEHTFGPQQGGAGTTVVCERKR
jgi:hypothetical protein